MLILLATAAALDCAGGTDPARLLDSNRRAVMSAAATTGISISRYTLSAEGTTGEAVSTVDLRTGSFRKAQWSGIVGAEEGFDGREAWSRDLSGFVKPQTGGNQPALARNEAYRNANLWWRSDRGGAKLESIGCRGIRVTPKGGASFDAWFDPSGLLARTREMRTFGTVAETRYFDYRREGGRQVPGRIEIVYGDNPDNRELFTLRDVSVTPGRRPLDFAMPHDNPADWQLPAARRVTMPFRLMNNHIIVDATINGQGPFPFLVDTGGHDILTPATMAALKLGAEGVTHSSGAGEKTISGGYAEVGEIQAGGAVLRNQTVVVLDFSPVDVEGLQLGGMLGVEFLERFVVKVDYGAKLLTLIAPDRVGRAERRSWGQAVPTRFYEHMPQIDGSVDGRPASFNIDTGARDELTLTRPFVERYDLARLYPGGVTMTTGWGVGGPSRSYTVRAGEVALGPVRVERPTVGLSTAKRGSFSDSAYDGNVGSGLLKRFVVTFDYAGRAMYLKRLAASDPDVGSFDRSGMWVNRAPEGLAIMDVLGGGPAEQAGLKVGDIVTMVDDVPIDRRSLSDWRRHFKLAPVSKPIVLHYRRSGADAIATVQPRTLIPD